MAQVNSVAGFKRPDGALDAIVRALQGYQAFTAARQNSAQTDAINAAQDREANGVLDVRTKAALAEKGATISSEPVAGGFKFSEPDEESDSGFRDVYIKPPTTKAEIETPLQALQRKKLEQELQQGGPAITPYQNAQLALERQRLAEQRAEKEAKAGPKTFDERLKGLNASDKARFDNIKMASKAVDDMGAALAAGQRTFSVFGDNDFTIAERDFAEALGRMQSGGAITTDEEKRFAAMAPRVFDSPETRVKKLDRLKAEMESRLSTLGFTRDEVPELANRKSPVKSKAPSGQAIAAPEGPKVGTEENGYVFQGGDPADPKSWKKK